MRGRRGTKVEKTEWGEDAQHREKLGKRRGCQGWRGDLWMDQSSIMILLGSDEEKPSKILIKTSNDS